MSRIISQGRSILKCCKNTLNVRQLSVSPILRIKEVIEEKKGKTLTISAEIKLQEDSNLMKLHPTGACPLCSYGLEVKHTDVLILSQFLDKNGKLLNRKVTGLCLTQQRRVDYLIEMARAAGLLSKSYKTEPTPKNKKYMDFNTYYDEETIKSRYF